MTIQEALLRAIVAEAEEDSHRLVYADWLDEEAGEGRDRDPGRAEFIRVQCELAAQPECHWQSASRCNPDSHSLCHPCERHHVLTARESALIAAHDARWQTGPTCRRCDGTGHTLARLPVTGRTDRCLDCWGGDAGGLKRIFGYPNPDYPVGGEPDSVRLTYRAGFVHRVTVPTMADLVTWERIGTAEDMSDRHDEYVPTSWFTAVARHWPTICQAVALDRVPHVLQTGKAIWHQQGQTPPAMSEVPNCLLSADVVLTHPTADAAVTALGRATMTWARSRATS